MARAQDEIHHAASKQWETDAQNATAETRLVSARRSRLLNAAALGLWLLTAAVIVALSLLGVRPMFSVLAAPAAAADALIAMWPVAAAQAIAAETTLDPAYLALALLLLIGLFTAAQITLSFLVVRQQRRQPFTWFNWFVAFFLLLLGAMAVQDILIFGAGVLAPAAFDPGTSVVSFLGYTSLMAFIFLFPDGRFVPRWAALGPVAFLVLWFVAPELVLLLFPLGFASLFYRYLRVATPLQRQQMKWVVWGLTLALVPSMIIVSAIDHPAKYLLITFFYLFIPVTIAIAMVRSHLWDVDIIIRKTLVYATLTVLLAGVYFGVVTLLTGLFSAISGEPSPLVIVVSTLLIAALFTPLRRRVQDGIDRRFFRQKYDAQQVLARFAETARYKTDIDELAAVMSNVIQESLQPEQITIWLRGHE
jgi:hypothetical protein